MQCAVVPMKKSMASMEGNRPSVVDGGRWRATSVGGPRRSCQRKRQSSPRTASMVWSRRMKSQQEDNTCKGVDRHCPACRTRMAWWSATRPRGAQVSQRCGKRRGGTCSIRISRKRRATKTKTHEIILQKPGTASAICQE